MINSNYNYYSPESLSDAYDLKVSENESIYLGGGTDYIPLLKYNLKAPKSIISLDKISEIKGIRTNEESIYIGAMTTLREIYESKEIQQKLPSLCQAARRVASPQIRNIGTIAGNILQDRRCMYFNQSENWRLNIDSCFKLGGLVCLQSPASKVCKALYYSDIAPVLISLDAKAEIFDGKFSMIPVSKIIEDHIDLNGFISTQDYILTGFSIPYLPDNNWTKFEKYSIRDSLNFAIMNAGIRYSRFKDKVTIKIMVGAVSPFPIELKETEEMIVDKLNNLEQYRDDIKNQAILEITKQSKLVMETGLSIPAKRKTFNNIINLIEELINNIIKNK